MTIVSRYEGQCRNCGGRIRPGDRIDWAKGAGAAHDRCPDQPEPVPTSFGWAKVGEEWVVRVRDPQDAQEYEGETVTVTSRAGRQKTVTLGALLQANSSVDCLYTVADAKKQQEDLPEVPDGRYAIGIDDDLFLVKVVKFRNGSVHVFDVDDRNREYPAKKLLEAIDVMGAGVCAQAYGRLRGRCYRCDSPLANRLSVELGVGAQVCLEHLYGKEAAAVRRQAAREKLRAEGVDPYETVRTEVGEEVSV